MKHREADRDYVAAFIEEKGGYMEVVGATGIGKQTLWQLATKRNGISEKIADQLNSFYPDFDVARARGLTQSIAPRPVTTLASVDNGDAIYWKHKYTEMEHKYDKAMAEVKSLSAQLSQLLEMNGFFKKVIEKLDPTLFKESDSQTTVFPMPRTAIGFVQQATEGKVLMHPATAGQLRMLNSLAPVAGAQG